MTSTYYDTQDHYTTQEPYELYDSDNSNNSTIISIRGDLDESTRLLKNNIKKVTDRDQLINSIESKTDDLMEHSNIFKRKSRQLQSRSCIQAYFCELILLFISLIIIITLIVVISKK
jgi:hypothetical protein